MYDFVLRWADTPYGRSALFVLAFIESSFFPIPPDVLLIALCIATPTRSFTFALICSVGSALGGIFGYGIGYFLFETVGRSIIDFYQLGESYQLVQEKFNAWGAWFVAVAGFTPVPYKVITITAGAFKMNLLVFALVSLFSRAARFFLVAALIRRFGAPIRTFIDRYFNLLTLLFFILLGLGFLAVKYLF